VLNEGDGVANQSDGYKRMEKTKWHTLVGSTIVVVSSTVLYINGLFSFTMGGSFNKSPWLSVVVFGINLGSILNNIGMVVLSGVLKNASISAVAKSFTSARNASKKESFVEVEASFEFNSNAYNEPSSVAIPSVVAA
jgi:hypothetical protein